MIKVEDEERTFSVSVVFFLFNEKQNIICLFCSVIFKNKNFEKTIWISVCFFCFFTKYFLMFFLLLNLNELKLGFMFKKQKSNYLVLVFCCLVLFKNFQQNCFFFVAGKKFCQYIKRLIIYFSTYLLCYIIFYCFASKNQKFCQKLFFFDVSLKLSCVCSVVWVLYCNQKAAWNENKLRNDIFPDTTRRLRVYKQTHFKPRQDNGNFFQKKN